MSMKKAITRIGLLGQLAILWVAPSASAATMQAVYLGTVGSSTDVTGIFGASGASLDGSAFELTYIYDPAMEGSQRYTDAASDTVAGGAEYQNFNLRNSPVLSVSLSINGITYSMGANYNGKASVYSAPVLPLGATLHEGQSFLSSGLNYENSNIRINLYTLDPALVSLFPSSLDTAISIGFVAGLEFDGYFNLIRCVLNEPGPPLYCADGTLDQAEGYLRPTSVVISQVSLVPLPAALPLLASGLGALGIIGWRRKKKVSIAA